MNETDVTVIGVEQNTNKVQGSHGFGKKHDEHLVVEHDGERIEVPITAVRTGAYDYYGFPQHDGELPESIDFERVFIYDDELHAETPLDNGLVEMYGGEMHFIETEYGSGEFPVVWSSNR